MAFGERKESGEGPIWCHLSLGLAGANQSFEPEDPEYFFNSLSQEETFAAFLDGMDSGAVLGYPPYPGSQLWNAVSQPFWPLTWSATRG